MQWDLPRSKNKNLTYPEFRIFETSEIVFKLKDKEQIQKYLTKC